MPKAKSKKTSDKESLRKQYEEIYPKYEQLAKNLKQALEIFLEEKGFDYVGGFSRIKEFDSFWDKIHRKGYDKPFEQNEDFCGPLERRSMQDLFQDWKRMEDDYAHRGVGVLG